MWKRPAVLLATVLATSSALAADEPAREQARSVTMTPYGIVATSQTVASQAGAAVLAKGGSAVDAAIAANAALGVIEPMMNGIGGDLFAIVYESRTKRLYGLNASGWAPAQLSIEALKARGLTKLRPIDQVTVPGTVAGWEALRGRWGKLPLSTDLAPAIALAERGVAVTEGDAENWALFGPPHAADPGFAPTFLPGGKPPGVGKLFSNPGLARSLRLIAEQAARASTKARRRPRSCASNAS